TGWAIMPGRSNSSKKRSSWCRRIRRSTTIWVTPFGRAAACRKRAINGSGHCSSDHKRTRSSRSRRSCRAASRRCRPRPRTAAEPTEGGVAVRAFAPAKVNLYLHVIGRRADGYHLLDSLIAFADIGDTITAAPADALALMVDGPEAAGIAGLGDDNLVFRAARLVKERGGIEAGAALHLEKRLPAAGGIGGGSSDAAAALRALSYLWDRPLDNEALAALALELGADVPACLAARPVWVGGIGEELQPAPFLPAAGIVLANPRRPLLTADVFRRWAGPFSSAARFEPVPADAARLVAALNSRHNGLTGPIVVLDKVRPGSDPITRLGRSQVVRHRILIPAFPGSNPGAPASFLQICYLLGLAQVSPNLPPLLSPLRGQARHDGAW